MPCWDRISFWDILYWYYFFKSKKNISTIWKPLKIKPSQFKQTITITFLLVHMERYLSHDLLRSFQLLASLMLPCQVTLLPSQSQALSNKRPMSFPQLWANLQGMKLVSKINKQPGFLSHYFAWCIWLKSCFQKTTTYNIPSNCSVFTKSQFHWFTSYLGFGWRFLRINSAGTCHLFLRNFGRGLGPVPSSVSSNAIFLAMLGAVTSSVVLP